MNGRKRIAAVLLTAVLTAAMTGCGSKKDGSETASDMSFENGAETHVIPELPVEVAGEQTEDASEAIISEVKEPDGQAETREFGSVDPDFSFAAEEIDPAAQAALDSVMETGAGTTIMFSTQSPLYFEDVRFGETFSVNVSGIVRYYESAAGEVDEEQLKGELIACLTEAVSQASGRVGFDSVFYSAKELEKLVAARLINEGWYIDGILFQDISLDEESSERYDKLMDELMRRSLS